MTRKQNNTFSTERQVGAITGNGYRVEWRDLKSSGLTLRVSANGDRKTWRYQYRLGGRGSRLIRINLGEWHRDPALGMSLEDARRTVLTHRKTIAEGGVPQIEKTVERQRAEGITFGRLVERYVDEYVPLLSKNHGKNSTKRLRDYCVPAWGALPATAVTRAMVDAVTKPVAKERHPDGRYKKDKANKLFANIGSLYSWAHAKTLENDAEIGVGGGITTKPTQRPPMLVGSRLKNVTHLPGGAPAVRHMALNEDEIGKLLRRLRVHGLETRPSRIDPTIMVRERWADDQRTCAHWLHLKLLTGARGGEVRQMRWTDIYQGSDNGLGWRIPSEHSKNGHAHEIPLTDQAVAVLNERGLGRTGDRKSRFVVFPQKSDPRQPIKDFKRSFHTLCKAAGLDRSGGPRHVQAHDLRRTFAAQLGLFTRDDDETPRYTREFRGILLNHRTEANASSVTARHYDPNEYLPAKRKALQVWADFLDTQILGVAPIARARRSA